MRRSTAVRRLRTIAERCEAVCALWPEDGGLRAVHTYGDVLERPEDSDGSVEVLQLALVVEGGPDPVSWGSRPAGFAGLAYVLELERWPVDWCFRSAARPVGNHRIDRPLRIWARGSGVDERALSALEGGTHDRLREPRPRPDVARRLLEEELAVGRAHLEQLHEQYWRRPWREEHHTAGMYPEHYLWDAVHGYLDVLAAAERGPAAEPEQVQSEEWA